MLTIANKRLSIRESVKDWFKQIKFEKSILAMAVVTSLIYVITRNYLTNFVLDCINFLICFFIFIRYCNINIASVILHTKDSKINFEQKFWLFIHDNLVDKDIVKRYANAELKHMVGIIVIIVFTQIIGAFFENKIISIFLTLFLNCINYTIYRLHYL